MEEGVKMVRDLQVEQRKKEEEEEENEAFLLGDLKLDLKESNDNEY